MVRAAEALRDNGVDVMVEPTKDIGCLDGNVLVELEPHWPGTSGMTSCFASQASYAAAARTPSSVKDG